MHTKNELLEERILEIRDRLFDRGLFMSDIATACGVARPQVTVALRQYLQTGKLSSGMTKRKIIRHLKRIGILHKRHLLTPTAV